MTDLLDRDHDDDLDRRLRAAMTDIAAGYRPDTGRQQHAATAGRGRWIVGAAAAAVAVLGISGVWALNRDTTGPAATETTQILHSAAPWLSDLTLPDVPIPEWAVRLDPSLVGELPINSPFVNWVYSRDPIVSRWFVQSDGDRSSASIFVAEQLPWLWSDDAGGQDIDLDGVNAYRESPSSIWWRRDSRVWTISTTGIDSKATSLLAAAASRSEDLAELAVPDGYTEIHYQPWLGWQYQEAGWSASVAEYPPDEIATYLSLWATGQPIEGGWLLGKAETSWTAIVQIGSSVVRVGAPGTADESAMREIARHASIVPAGDVPVSSISSRSDGTLITEDDLLAGGELAWGRWLAVDGRDERTASDVQCLEFLGAVDVEGCSEPGSAELTLCRRLTSNPAFVNETGRWVAVTSLPIEPDAELIVTVAGEAADYTVQQSGGLTFVLGATGGAVHSISIEMPNGRQLCTG